MICNWVSVLHVLPGAPGSGCEFSWLCVGSVDRRVESEESGDEEGKKQSSGIVADLSEHSLKDGEERGHEEPEGTRPR